MAASARRNGFTRPGLRLLKRDVGSLTGGTERLGNRRQAQKNRTTGGQGRVGRYSVLRRVEEISNADGDVSRGALQMSAQSPLIRALAGGVASSPDGGNSRVYHCRVHRAAETKALTVGLRGMALGQGEWNCSKRWVCVCVSLGLMTISAWAWH